jgi:hypothetical protein
MAASLAGFVTVVISGVAFFEAIWLFNINEGFFTNFTQPGLEFFVVFLIV